MSDETGKRLLSIQQELASILEARLAELTEAMKQTELVTRRIVAAEVELDRHTGTRTQLAAELAGLEQDTQDARARADEIRGAHGVRLRERDVARGELERLEREVREVDAEVEQNRQRARDLEATSETLRRENAALKTRLKTLEENVARMRQLQKELMASMSDVTQQMTGGDKG